MKSITRRTWLKATTLSAITAIFGAQAKQLKSAVHVRWRSERLPNGFAGTLRDRLWISVALGNLAMTPAESALYLGVPNVILAGSATGQSLSRQLALSLSGFTRVVWPADGHEHFIGAVRPLLAEFPNIAGVLLDCARQPMFAELNRVRDALGHKDLWASISPEQLNALKAGYELLQCAYAVIVWPEKNERLEPLFARVERQMPAADILLGCSLRDDPERQAKNRVRSQCEFALKAIQENRLAGLVFGTATGISGESEVVAQTQEWISHAGGQKL